MLYNERWSVRGSGSAIISRFELFINIRVYGTKTENEDVGPSLLIRQVRVQQNVTFDSSGKLHPLLGLDKRLPIENLHGPQPVYEPMDHYQHVGGLPLHLYVISE